MAAQSPEQCDELFGQYLNVGDVDRLAALYSPEASLIGQDGVPASGTRDWRFLEMAGNVSDLLGNVGDSAL